MAHSVPVPLAQPIEPSPYLCLPVIERRLVQSMETMGPREFYEARKAFFLGFYSATNHEQREKFMASSAAVVVRELYGEIKSNAYKRTVRDFMHMWQDFLAKFFGKQWASFEYLVTIFDDVAILEEEPMTASWLDFCTSRNHSSIIPTGIFSKLQLSPETGLDSAEQMQNAVRVQGDDRLEDIDKHGHEALPSRTVLGDKPNAILSNQSPNSMVSNLMKTTAKSKKLSKRLLLEIVASIHDEAADCTRPEILLYALDLVHEQAEHGRGRHKAIRMLAVSLMNSILRMDISVADIKNIVRAILEAASIMPIDDCLQLLMQTILNANAFFLLEDGESPTEEEILSRKRNCATSILSCIESESSLRQIICLLSCDDDHDFDLKTTKTFELIEKGFSGNTSAKSQIESLQLAFAISRLSYVCYKLLVPFFVSIVDNGDNADIVTVVAYAALCDLINCHIARIDSDFIFQYVVPRLIDIDPKYTLYGLVCLGKALLNDEIDEQLAMDIVVALGKVWIAAPHHTHGSIEKVQDTLSMIFEAYTSPEQYHTCNNHEEIIGNATLSLLLEAVDDEIILIAAPEACIEPLIDNIDSVQESLDLRKQVQMLLSYCKPQLLDVVFSAFAENLADLKVAEIRASHCRSWFQRP